MTPSSTKAPDLSGNSIKGQDPNPYQEEQITVKTTSPILASAPDNEELTRSGDSVLVQCDEAACAYRGHGHYADRLDPLFMHRYVGVADNDFHIVIERLSSGGDWELSIEMRFEDMAPERALRFARVLTKCAEIAQNLNAERA